ncbi:MULTISPECIES: GNAT family N-acetyltransferase [unclassified Bradyrhizobium]|uniref:GNAT family N-acetyltransferase n=1 Tax=unclassified Bradyrhizobium TaxID=2631580 RepID=UPI00247832D4|nr:MULTISPECIES: GNAT family N-acetyltransferase [unclassified Bradyrhizobium]WGS23082.1 GNAT family N-acetyltransferase [Bradyrhizobium sp. ISRA463]WGS30084.1 GNAT family N-acetyltransferase [Bradyrhizobium sp. ISRA464]
MADIAHQAVSRGASRKSAADRHALPPLSATPVGQWRALADRAIEANGYYQPDWELAVDASARGRTGAKALSAFGDGGQLIGFLPVVSMRRIYRIPLPALVGAEPYGTLCTPLLDRHAAEDATAKLLRQARSAGAHALILRTMSLEGPAMAAIRAALARDGLQSHVLSACQRAELDATRDADELLRDALGAKKLKELRRQRNRLAEHGAVRFDVARTPRAVAAALETFLALEAGGWKGKRGTALSQHPGDAAFIRRATSAMAEIGRCEIVTLQAGGTPVAGGIVLRHQDRAFFFKIGIDERFAKCSPGAQLTLDLTRHLCADPAIVSADSTAAPGHPMIDPIWRARFAIGDVLIPLRCRDPLVPAIHAALTVNNLAYDAARGAVRFIRNRRGKSG